MLGIIYKPWWWHIRYGVVNGEKLDADMPHRLPPNRSVLKLSDLSEFDLLSSINSTELMLH